MTSPEPQPTTDRSTRPVPVWIDLLLLLGVVVLAGALRAYHLGYKSLWLDEVTYVRSAQMGGLFGPYGLASISHPPAYLFILRLIGGLGREEWLLRLPALIASVLGVVALWGLGRVLLGRVTAVLAAFMLAVSALHLEYAQEAHSYALFGTLSTFLLWSLAWLAKRSTLPAGRWPSVAAWAVFVALATAGLYVHYYALVPIALSIVVFPCFLLAFHPGPIASLWRDPAKRRALLHLGIALFVVGLLFLPQLTSQLSGSARVAAERTEALDAGTLDASFELTPSLLGNTLLAFITNRTPWSVDPLFVPAVALLWLSGLVWLLWRRKSVGVALLAWMLLPLPIIAWFAYRSGFSFAPRRLIFILPVFLLIAASGVVALAELASKITKRLLPTRPKLTPWVSWITILLVMAAFVKGSIDPVAAYYARPKQDWKGLAMILRTMPQPGDAIVVLPNATSPLSWYYPTPHTVISQDLVPKLQTLCEKSPAVYVAVAGTGGKLSGSDAEWLTENYIRVPLKDLRLYYRNCRPDAWYGDGAEELFKLARRPGLNFPPAGRALEEYQALAAQQTTNGPSLAMPAPSATNDMPATPTIEPTPVSAPEPTPAATRPPVTEPTAAVSQQTVLPDPSEGLDPLLAALAQGRSDSAGLLWQGAYHARQGDIERATDLFEQAIEQEPTRWLAYALLADALTLAGQNEQAQDVVVQGLRANPDNTALAELQARLGGELAASSDRLRDVLDQGRAALRVQDFSAALTAGQQAVALDPKRYEGYLLLGDAYRASGEPSQALTSYQRAIEAEPQISVLHSRQSEMLGRLGQTDEALSTALVALALEDGRWENWLSLGRVLATLSKDDAGYRDWTGYAIQRAVDLAPEGSQAPARLLDEFRSAQP